MGGIIRLLENERDGLKRILNEWDANMMSDRNEEKQLYLERLTLLHSQYSEMEATMKQFQTELQEKDRLNSSLKRQVEEWNAVKDDSSSTSIPSLRSKLVMCKTEVIYRKGLLSTASFVTFV